MTIRQIRLFELLSLLIIAASKQYSLLYYCSAMYLSLEFLNSRREYTEQARYKFYNSLFIAFQLLYCVDRLRTTPYKLNNGLEGQMNSVEHILFAFIICFKIVQYLHLSIFKDLSLKRRILITFVFFNIFGFFVEMFQNSLTADATIFFWHGTTSFSTDNIKDMQMNLMGSILFSISMLYESQKVN